jgi:hypothetical protein
LKKEGPDCSRVRSETLEGYLVMIDTKKKIFETQFIFGLISLNEKGVLEIIQIES